MGESLNSVASVSKSELRLADKLAALVTVVRALKPVYEGASEKKELRRLIETLIGAAIWYLPQSRDLWTGRISLSALRALPGVKLSRDHNVPRKIAAAQLLRLSDDELHVQSLSILYEQTLGRFNLVTREENRRLMPYQRAEVYQSSESAYAKAGIQLVNAEQNPAVLAALSGRVFAGNIKKADEGNLL